MRLFVGIPVSDKIKEEIRLVYEQLKAINCDLSLVPLRNLHFTLTFIGDLVNKNKIVSRLSEIKYDQFEIAVAYLSSFNSKDNLKVIWVGEKSGNLNHLAYVIREKLSDTLKDEFSYKTHLTLARVKSKRNTEQLKKLIRDWANKDFGMMTVDKFVLYESKLTKDGPVYSVIKEFSLEKI